MKVRLFIALLLLGWAGVEAYSQSASLKDLVYRKKYAEVVKLSKTFTAADSANYETMFALAQAYEGLLKNKDAYRCYLYCLKKDSTNVDLLNAIGRTAGSLGHVEEALGCFQKVIYADSTDFYANYQMARLYMQQGNYEAAAYNFQYLMQFDEENSVLWKNLGDCQMMLPSGTVFAIMSYLEAFRLNPENPSLAHLVVNTLLPLGEEQLPVAIQVCDTALSYNPQHKMLIRDKAIALYMDRKYETADSLFTSLLLREDSSYINLKYAGASRFKAGMYMNAIDPLEKAWEQDTTSVEVNLLLGAALGMTYDRKRALELLDRAEEYMQPGKDYLYQLAYYRGEVYQKDRNPLKANQYYYEAYQVYPRRVSILQRMALMFDERKAEKYEDEGRKQRGLFNTVAFVRAVLKEKEERKDMRFLTYYKSYLKSFQEEMFFKNLDKQPMMSPTGRKSYITKDELQELIAQLPDREKREEKE